MTEETLVLGLISIIIFVGLYMQNNRLNDIEFICENSILKVPLAVMYISDCKSSVILREAVVSTFGLLIGNKMYKWDCDGLQGIRLNAIEIDRAKFYITFGNKAKTIRVEFLHGITNQQVLLEVKEKLRYETGVIAIISDW